MGATVVAILIRRERELVDLFRRRGAVSRDTAMTIDALGAERRFAWRRLVARAVIREGTNGTFYLDEPSREALVRARRRIVAVLVVIVVALAFIFYVAYPRG